MSCKECEAANRPRGVKVTRCGARFANMVCECKIQKPKVKKEKIQRPHREVQLGQWQIENNWKPTQATLNNISASAEENKQEADYNGN